MGCWPATPAPGSATSCSRRTSLPASNARFTASWATGSCTRTCGWARSHSEREAASCARAAGSMPSAWASLSWSQPLACHMASVCGSRLSNSRSTRGVSGVAAGSTSNTQRACSSSRQPAQSSWRKTRSGSSSCRPSTRRARAKCSRLTPRASGWEADTSAERAACN